MSQRDKEETEMKVSESVTLCINDCGFSVNPATKNMCPSCKEKTRSSFVRLPDRPDCHPRDLIKQDDCNQKEVNRCSGCRRKV
ncbi:hypothetical protein MKX01_002326 [Papaver californicum]|nr:hypothetical protein MKX01_002326 [Papaver californicum]